MKFKILNSSGFYLSTYRSKYDTITLIPCKFVKRYWKEPPEKGCYWYGSFITFNWFGIQIETGIKYLS